MKKKTKIWLLIGSGVIAGSLPLLAIWAFLIEPNRLIVHEETIVLANWPSSIDGLRMTAISDIHAGSPFIDVEKLERVVAKTNHTNPDLIVLLGDFMVQESWLQNESNQKLSRKR